MPPTASLSIIKERKEKKLWTENVPGDWCIFKQYDSEYDEAEGVVSYINFLAMRGVPYEDMAILYRTNAQSRLLEERCIFYNVPYRLVGGVNFYQRREIKDILAYLKTIANGVDDLSVLRIINVPKRGDRGQPPWERWTAFASEHG